MGELAVIGASGFVGGALCERLFFEGRTHFRAYIHSSGSAARLARLPLRLHVLDLLDPEQTNQALEGVETVVNCSRGDTRTMLTGLTNLLRSAKRNRVKKLIHLSSTAIYGEDPPLASESESCLPDPQGNEYGATKLRQDTMVLKLHAAGVPCYILCPGNISGPLSGYTLGQVRRADAGPMALVDDGQNPTNLVHVDNLVEAILAAERASTGSGERYFVNELHPVSWKQHYADLGAAAGVCFQFEPVSRDAVLVRLRPPRKPAGLLEHVRIALSGEFRRALMMMPALKWLNDRAADAFQRLPDHCQKSVRRRFERAPRIPDPPETLSLVEPLVRVQVRRPFHAPQKAVEKLGFQPALSYEQGLQTTAAWLQFVLSRIPSSTIYT